MKKVLQILAIPVLLFLGAFGWSYLNKPTLITINRITPSPVQKQNEPTKISTNIPSPTENILPSIPVTTPLVYANPSVAIDAIYTAIPGKRYSEFLPLMTSSVTLIKYASSCCGLIPKAQAVKEMEYLNGAVGPWDFSEKNPVLAKLEVSDPDNFKDAFVGTSANNYAVGITLNDDFLISKIILVSDYRLITGQ